MTYALMHVFAKLAAFILLPILSWIFGKLGLACDWKYRNPADRTCRRCGLNQNEYEYWGDPNCRRWEDMSEVSARCGLLNLIARGQRLGATILEHFKND